MSFTSFPNWLLDDIMPNVSSSEWLIICAIARKTIGWNKVSDKISYSQLQKATGIKHPGTINESISSLVAQGIITREHDGKQGYSYSITTSKNEVVEDQTTSKNEPLQKMNHFKNGSGSTSKNEVEPLQKMKTQYTKESKEINIYIHPDDDDIAEIKTALSVVSKTPLWSPTENEYDQAAHMVKGWNCTGKDVKAFGEWWKVNGWHKGKPVLKVALSSMRDYLDSKADNGHKPQDLSWIENIPTFTDEEIASWQ